MSIAIHHNRDCRTSRNILGIIRSAGEEREVIEYIETGWSRSQVRLCRPSKRVLDLLETLPAGPWYKEDGEMLINAQGERVG